jgi:hypothetical protein
VVTRFTIFPIREPRLPYTPRSTRKRISYAMRQRTHSVLLLLAMPIARPCRVPMHPATAVTRQPRSLPISCAKRRPLDIVLLVTTERVKPFDRWDHSLRPRTDFVVTRTAEQSSRLTVEAIAAVETLLRDAVRTLPTPMMTHETPRCDVMHETMA